jgi:N,N'-diacetyllegionaminate synthase
MRTLIIAEAGVNHNGDMELARQLIDAAAEAGADIVKFQTFKADRLVTASAKKAAYQLVTTDADESQHEMIRQLELSEAMHEQLIAHCKLRGIEFFSTAFDIESLDYLMSLGMERIKIPSGEITNLPYLRRVGSFGKPVILSTGMSNLGEIEAALAVHSIGQAFCVRVGFSDHTEGIEIAVAAVALGACIIEKHITLDRELPGPDHRASIEPDEFACMVRSIRNLELALGDGIKRPSASEERNSLVARKSLVAARAIAKGELFSEQNLVAKRPGTGISPMRLDELLGRPAPRDFAPDEQIQS